MPWTPHHCYLAGVSPPSMPELSFSVRPWLALRPAEGDAPGRERLMPRCRARYIGQPGCFFTWSVCNPRRVERIMEGGPRLRVASNVRG